MDDGRVGKRLRALREAADMSQADLAEAAQRAGWDGVYPQTVLKVEKGTRSLKLTEAAALASALGVEVGALLVETDDARTAANVRSKWIVANTLATRVTEMWREFIEAQVELRGAVNGAAGVSLRADLIDEARWLSEVTFDEIDRRARKGISGG